MPKSNYHSYHTKYNYSFPSYKKMYFKQSNISWSYFDYIPILQSILIIKLLEVKKYINIKLFFLFLK
jgi:hypothetical protein